LNECGGVKADGWFHRHHRKQREKVIWHHVAQGAGRLVKGPAPLHSDRFGSRNLHVVNAVAIPDRLEKAIGETKRHDVLDRVLAEKVINPKNLILVQRAQDLGIQRAR
jgi:hypothetical protein